MDEREFRIKKARKPSLEELLRFSELPREERFSYFARLFLVPENPSRQAYTVLRKIYLALLDDFWNVSVHPDQQHIKEWASQVIDNLDKQRELESWFRPALPPLSPEKAANLIEGSKSEFWRQTIINQAGKRSRAGQPSSKRYLALRAIDIKCAYPDTSLRDVTDILCPCGKDEHITQCREQLRQQINRLVKFLRTHGYDFTWERIKTEGWKVSQ